MTEAEAKNVQCCGPEGCGKVRSLEPFYNTFGDVAVHQIIRVCIASACMAWRKTGAAKVENRRGQLVDRDEDGTGRWHYDGFCGLAGKP